MTVELTRSQHMYKDGAPAQDVEIFYQTRGICIDRRPLPPFPFSQIVRISWNSHRRAYLLQADAPKLSRPVGAILRLGVQSEAGARAPVIAGARPALPSNVYACTMYTVEVILAVCRGSGGTAAGAPRTAPIRTKQPGPAFVEGLTGRVLVRITYPVRSSHFRVLRMRQRTGPPSQWIRFFLGRFGKVSASETHASLGTA